MDQSIIPWNGDAYIDTSLKQQHGPILATIQSGQYSHVYLYPLDQAVRYIDWLKQQSTNIVIQYEYLSNLQGLGDTHHAAGQLLVSVIKQYKIAKFHLQITPAIRAYYFRNICCYPYSHLLQETQ